MPGAFVAGAFVMPPHWPPFPAMIQGCNISSGLTMIHRAGNETPSHFQVSSPGTKFSLERRVRTVVLEILIN